MPTYLTVQEYRDRFGDRETTNLTDEDRSGSPDTTKVEEAIETAESEVNGYVGRRYSLPLSEIPSLLKSITGALSRNELYKTSKPEAVTRAADEARRQLRDIAKGVLILQGATEVIESDTGQHESETSEDGRKTIFTNDSLDGFGVGELSRTAKWRS